MAETAADDAGTSAALSNDHFQSQSEAQAQAQAAVEAQVTAGKGPAVEVQRSFANIKVEPKAGEAAEPNFPRNIHNACELFVRCGLVANAKRCADCAAQFIELLASPPDGRSSCAVGRAAVCWECGYIGLPRNGDAAPAKGYNGPLPACGRCGSAAQTNFVRVEIRSGGGGGVGGGGAGSSAPSNADGVAPWLQAEAPDMSKPARDANESSGTGDVAVDEGDVGTTTSKSMGSGLGSDETAAEERKRLEAARQAAMDSWDDELVSTSQKSKPKQTSGKKKKGKKGKKK